MDENNRKVGSEDEKKEEKIKEEENKEINENEDKEENKNKDGKITFFPKKKFIIHLESKQIIIYLLLFIKLAISFWKDGEYIS